MKVDRNNIDEYYKKVNDAIDHYFQYDISAFALQRYFKGKYGMDRFLKREGLDEVERIDKVVMDVIEDRVAREEAVLTFEEFNIDKKEFNIETPLEMDVKKQLADFYRVSLGHLENVDKMGVIHNNLDNNHFRIQTIGMNKIIYVITHSLLKELKLKVCDIMYKKSISNTISLPFIDLESSLSNKIDEENFKSKLYMELSDRTDVIENIISFVSGDKYVFKKLLDSGSLIFELEKS